MRTCPNCSRQNPLEGAFCTHCRPLPDGHPAETRPIAAQVPGRDIEDRFQPGRILADRYRIVAPLGRGGMGEVYRATDLTLRQPVALKFLAPSLADNPRALHSLYSEVRLARQISHPNVCRVYDIGEADGLHFLIMEYVQGKDLRSLLRRIDRVAAARAAELAGAGRRLLPLDV